ncbi:hypothetical protein LCGC14_1787120 [marine sediment metagenome]|uniref:Uncharacterized protein n=1 Tax=marine sediment metagenome TaxID=412755 RepID=A0A0F9GTL6_9ZZZZ
MATSPQPPPIRTATFRALPAKTQPTTRQRGAGIVVFAWILLAIATVLGSLALMAGLGSAVSAVQEAALGAMFAAFFVAGYILARCVEKIVLWTR